MSHHQVEPTDSRSPFLPKASTIVVTFLVFVVLWFVVFPLVFHIIAFIAKLIIIMVIAALIVGFWRLTRTKR